MATIARAAGAVRRISEVTRTRHFSSSARAFGGRFLTAGDRARALKFSFSR